MKIVVDAFGGDFSPNEVVKGAAEALNAENGFEIVFTGDKTKIENLLAEYKCDVGRVSVIDAPEIITNDEAPTEAVRSKEKSSLVAGLNYLSSDEDAKGFVSAGSTGAVLTGAVLLLKRIRGVNRPALCPVLPSVKGKNVLLMDCGANVDSKALNIVQFAVMASAYSKTVLGVENPAVGLLSNGAEDKKGNALGREAFPLLKENEKINFRGNIEARDILTGDVDVVVCDGYSGNIALKACEGTALSMFSLIKDGIIKGGLRAKLGYLLLKPVFRDVKRKLDYNENGGAVLLGLEKVVVKSHGSSKAKAIRNSVLQAKKLVECGVVEKITNDIG